MSILVKNSAPQQCKANGSEISEPRLHGKAKSNREEGAKDLRTWESGVQKLFSWALHCRKNTGKTDAPQSAVDF